MGDEYIKKEDAIKAVASAYWQGTDCECYAFARKALDNAPIADVAPVRHGRWEATEWAANRSGEILIGRLCRCSECGRIIDLEHAETLNDYPYCHCGAKMDEVVDDEVHKNG